MNTPWIQFQSDFQNKKCLVFGLGLQGGGVGVANTLVAAGAKVRATDQKRAESLQTSLLKLDQQVECVLGEHRQSDIDWADIIIKNPAVSYNHDLLQYAINHQKEVVNESALALKYINQQTVGVTGTRGKTTTTTYIYHLLKTAGIPTLLAGNIPGKPLLAVLPKVDEQTIVAAELSSFQLESLSHTKVSPHVAVITSIHPDHLNRYKNIDQYVQTKTLLLTYQQPGDVAVLLADKPWSSKLLQAVAPEVENRLVSTKQVQQIKNKYQLQLLGEHNWENICLGIAAVKDYVHPDDVGRAIETFSAVEYRLQPIGTVDDVTYINDTTSTTPAALEKAVDALSDKKIVLIVGGASKNLPFDSELLHKLASIPQAIVFMSGEGSNQLKKALKEDNLEVKNSFTANNLTETVQTAHEFAQKLGAEFVLFSPGFASFEWFTNEFARGDEFNREFKKLKQHHK